MGTLCEWNEDIVIVNEAIEAEVLRKTERIEMRMEEATHADNEWSDYFIVGDGRLWLKLFSAEIYFWFRSNSNSDQQIIYFCLYVRSTSDSDLILIQIYL